MGKKVVGNSRERLDYSRSIVELLEVWPETGFFAVSLLKNGKTSRLESRTAFSFKKIIDSSEITWVNCCVDNLQKESPEIAKFYGFHEHLIKDLLLEKVSSYTDLDNELGLVFPAVKVRNLSVNLSRIVLLVKKNLVLTFHSRKVTRFMRFLNYAETFLRKISVKAPAEDKVTFVLLRLLDKINEKNFENLRLIEEEGEKISGCLIDENVPRQEIGKGIFRTKQTLIHYLGALWSSLDVMNSLRYGDSEVITDDKAILAEITSQANEIKTQISLSEHMSEVLSSGLEVIQSIYNNQLQIMNNRLAFMVTWLTVLGTAVLVPNTLATIFGIPSISEHLDWHTTIIILVASTIASGAFSYWVVKKKLPLKIQ